MTKRKVLWTFFLTLLILSVLEGVIRLTVPVDLYPYGQEDQGYRAFQYYLDHLGPADVCFLGSSRGREDIVVPEVSRLLDKGGLKGLRVANYSLDSCLAAEANNIIRQITASKSKPRLIVYGISPAQLLDVKEPFRNSSLLWDVGDWLRIYRMRGNEILRYLPRAIRNQIRRWYETFQWREGLRPAIGYLLRRRPLMPNPLIGQLSMWQRDFPDKVFSPYPGFDAETQDYLNAAFKNGVDWMSEIQCSSLEDSARLCRERLVPLIFVELPLPSYFKQKHPGDVYGEFMSYIQGIAEQYGSRFFTLEELDLHLDDSEFRDADHANLQGALKVTRVLTYQVLLPLLVS